MESLPAVFREEFEPQATSIMYDTKVRKVSYPKLLKVKRAISFGPRIATASDKLFVEEELKKQMVRCSEKWNFDFEKEETLDKNGVYIWKAVKPREVFSRLKRRFEEDAQCEDLYYNPINVIPKTNETTVKIDEDINESTMKPPARQRLMTDYLQVRKRPTSETGKKNRNSIKIKKSRLAAS